MILSDPERLSAREQVAAVAARLGHGLSELATDIRDMVDVAVPALRTNGGDPGLHDASIQQSVDAALSMLAHGLDPAGANAPSVAVEEARRLAQGGVPTLALIRAYRVAERRLLHRLIEDLIRHTQDGSEEARATLEMVDRVATYADRIVEQLLTAYVEARKEWLDPNAVLAGRVRSVLSEELDLDTAQSRLGTYRLRQHHLGAELWVSDPVPGADGLGLLRRLGDAFATAAACQDAPLFVPVDDTSACIWLPFRDRDAVAFDAFASVLATMPGTYAAIGEVSPDLAGFRRTHQQAMSAEAVARVSSPPVERLTRYSEIAPIAPMASDLDAARKWVAETLGALAADDARAALFRETIRVFFATGSSYAATAEKLSLHRNTAQYRVRTAEQMRGRPFREGRLEVELALLACHWFGPAVLQPAAAKAR